MTDFLNDLNSEQRKVVESTEGPVLVLAGAGSGKTRVLTYRIAHLIRERLAEPWEILAMTFTNKAAGEMKDRIARCIGTQSNLWVGTFHSFGLYVLRRNIGELGRKSGFTIFDDADQLGLMKKLVKDLPKTYEPVTPREALGWISRHKQELEEPDPGTFEDGRDPTCAELWGRYTRTLVQANAVDFDDILVLTAKLLRSLLSSSTTTTEPV